MVVYGRNPVREALRGPREVRRAWVARPADWLTGVEVEQVDAAGLEKLCGSPDHQGVCAEVSEFEYADPDALLEAEDAIVLCLDQVQDPQNLGTACRVAEAAGLAGVVIPDRRAAQVTAAVCRASAGAVEHLAVARVGNVADWLGGAKRSEAWVYGADAAAGTPHDTPDYRGRVVLVLGSEGKGLRPRVAACCDALIALPQRGRVGSLNVSTAAAALVYGILQRRAALDRAP